MNNLEKTAFLANCLILGAASVGMVVSSKWASLIVPVVMLTVLTTLALSSLYFQSKRLLRLASMVIHGVLAVLAITAFAFLMFSANSPPESRRLIFRLAVILMMTPWILTTLALFSSRKKVLTSK
jgi:dolichyl-phosphate-mannose--protein O-mannosyl transferase